MSEAIERLNYFNGQRLEAEDFRLEQEFHIRIQRWLSKSLFSSGVADGLEVFPVADPLTGKSSKVLVTPGLALDDLGRAIILPRAVELVPQARFLCVRYAEHKERVQEGQCAVRGASAGAVAHSGGPERIVSDADFTWRRSTPRQDTRELVIAELELDSDCRVTAVVAGAQRVAVAAQVSRVAALGLEGEKDIATGTPKAIIFHVTGRRPNRILLCLRGLPISQLFYSELAAHTHASGALSLPAHAHSLSGVKTEKDGTHSHELWVRQIDLRSPDVPLGSHNHDLSRNVTHVFPTPSPFSVNSPLFEMMVIQRGVAVTLGTGVGSNDPNSIRKTLTGIGAEEPLSTVPTHQHAFKNDARTGPVVSAQGATDPISVGAASIGATGMLLRPEQGTTTVLNSAIPLPSTLFHVRNLTISYDGIPITDAILDRIREADPANFASWEGRLGNGDSTHPLVTKGTDLIRIDDLDLGDGRTIATNRGEHTITLTVNGPRNGGCVHYNLYVE